MTDAAPARHGGGDRPVRRPRRPRRHRARSLTLRQRLGLLLGISAAVFAIAAAILFTSLSTLADQRDAVVRELDPATLAVRDLRAAMIDQETGVRGYVITGDPVFLGPYDRGQSAELVAKTTLEPLATSTPTIAGPYDEARIAIDAWQREFASPAVDATLTGADEAAASDESQALGLVLFTEVRESVDRLEVVIGERRDVAVGELDGAADRVWTVVICVLIGLVALGIVIAVALNRSVTGPMVELAGEVRAIASGDLHRTITVEGTPEIERLADDVDAMRIRILGEIERLNEAYASIEQQSVELRRSNADLEQFAYVASHDLQEPLRKIAGFCQLLERRYQGQLDERADEYIAFVVDGAKRMQDLINDLLAFSRVGRNVASPEPIELDSVVSDAALNLRSAVEDSGAEIDVGPLPAVTGDQRLLVALFQNLIGNGIKFRGEDPPLVRVAAVAVGDRWEVSVSDNGIGIDDEYADQIFTIFQRLHNRTEYDGTGIGLALAKKIVEHHGGTIWLDNTVTEGSTFRFTLPAVPDDHADPSGTAQAEHPDQHDAVAGSDEPTTPIAEEALR